MAIVFKETFQSGGNLGVHEINAEKKYDQKFPDDVPGKALTESYGSLTDRLTNRNLLSVN